MNRDLNADTLAQWMLNAGDIQREILEETLDSAASGRLEESGRTICPASNQMVKPPIGRFPRAVELDTCPVGSVGIMHSHVSMSQLRQPEHSLPDIGNVLFHEVDASMVVGTREHATLTRAEDPERAGDLFRDALGLDVHSTGDIVEAMATGDIPEPSEARERVRRSLPNLFQRVPANYPDLDQEAEQLTDVGEIPAHAPIHAMCAPVTRPRNGLTAQTRRMRQRRSTIARQTAGGFIPPVQLRSSGEPVSIADEAVRSVVTATAVGAVFKIML